MTSMLSPVPTRDGLAQNEGGLQAAPTCHESAGSTGRTLHCYRYHLSLCYVPTTETSKHPLVVVGYILQMGKLRLKERRALPKVTGAFEPSPG